MRRAFTLVEVLVIIAIITVLIAILLPSFMKAKGSAYQTICASQMHQQGVVITSFAMDNDYAYPNPLKQGHWAFGGLINAGQSNDPSKQTPAGATHLYSEGYLDDPRIFYCPSTYKFAGITFDRHWRPSNFYSTFASYQYYAGYQVPGNSALGDREFAGETIESNRGEILSMDLIVADYSGWWMSNHIGQNEVPIGFNRLLIDQSVQWVAFRENTGSWAHYRQFYY